MISISDGWIDCFVWQLNDPIKLLDTKKSETTQPRQRSKKLSDDLISKAKNPPLDKNGGF
jgi:hypothetical protein